MLSHFVENYFDEPDQRSGSFANDIDEQDKKQIEKLSSIFKNEICEQPYSPIAFIVFLWFHPDSIRFINSYYKFKEMDIECFIRSNYDTAFNLVEGFHSDESISRLKQEIPDFKHIRV